MFTYSTSYFCCGVYFIFLLQSVLEQCCLSGNAFSLFLHHNYLGFFDNNPLTDVTAASDLLSLADTMNSSLTSSDLSSGASTHADRYEGEGNII